MICPTCGAVNEDGVLFCEKCKADLEMPAAGSPPQAPSPMNDPLVPHTDKPPADEPIPLEPVPLEPASDRTPPVSIEPPANASEPPIELEPVDAGAVAETAAGETATPAAPTAAIVNPRLEVLRGQRMDAKYPIYPGKNYIGRTDDKPVDIDLDDQEAPDRIWCSRQHAVITYENGALAIEDLNSLNGTFVNRARVHPGQVRELRTDDVIQIGTVHMKVVTG